MRELDRFLEQFMRPVRGTVRAIVVALFAIIVLVVFAQVVSRFVFNAPFRWSEELARYLQVWLILLASAGCIRKGLHLSVDYAVHALPDRLRRPLDLVALAGIAFFLVVVIVSGVTLIAATANQTTSALEIPIRAVYLALPAGAVLMLLETIALAVRRLTADSPEPGR